VHWNDPEGTAKVAALTRQLAATGESVVAPLMAEFDRRVGHVVAFRGRAIGVLQEIGTPPARRVLLDIACCRHGELQPALLEIAARAYLATSADPRDAWRLMDSPSPAVQTVGILKWPRPTALDEPRRRRLVQVVKTTPDEFLRSQAAAALACKLDAALSAEQTKRAARENVEAVLWAFTRLGALTREQIEKIPGIGFGDPGYTKPEWYREWYVCVLGTLPLAQDALKQLKPQGIPAKRAVLAARGMAGDESVRPALLELLRDRQAELARRWAAIALGCVGKLEDVPVLRITGAFDPIVRTRVSCLSARDFRPLDEAAKAAAQQIQERAKKGVR
jgi:hypothetical protein